MNIYNVGHFVNVVVLYLRIWVAIESGFSLKTINMYTGRLFESNEISSMVLFISAYRLNSDTSNSIKSKASPTAFITIK